MDSTTPFQPWAAKDGARNEGELVDDAKHHRENVIHPKHTQTASYNKESAVAVAPTVTPGPSSAVGSAADVSKAEEGKMDPDRIASMQQIVENTLSADACQRVNQLLDAVEGLSGPERLLLYLRLPTGVAPHDPLKQPVNPLGSRAELQQTVTWIQTHLEVDPDVSLPKQDVYDEYIAHCMSCNMKPLSTADFGKVMKQVYPTVRPRRLGTRGNSRYCYAGLRKKVKLEVPQLPDLGETSKETTTAAAREAEWVVCDWAASKLGVKFGNLTELSRHLLAAGGAPLAPLAPPAPAASPPPLPPLVPAPQHTHVTSEDPASRQLMKQLKRKIQTHGTPGRPKKYKVPEAVESAAASTSFAAPLHAVKHEGEAAAPYYPDHYAAYDSRPPFPYAPAPPPAPPPPPRAHPPPLGYCGDPYLFEGYGAAHDLRLPDAARDLRLPDAARNLPINLSSDASLDLSTERGAWGRRRPPEPPPPVPPPARLPLPGKKLILETYQSETRAPHHQPPPPQPAPAPDPPRTEYLPKKMRAAEIMGGKLAARHSPAAPDPPAAEPAPSPRTDVAFLEDPKNVTNRSKSTAAALAREEQMAASGGGSGSRGREGPAPRPRGRARRAGSGAHSPAPLSPASPASADSCCGLDGISIRTGMICEEKHAEILNRERVISICNIDKHDLDDYLNEGSQGNEEELQYYFQQRAAQPEPRPDAGTDFLETGLDPQDEHSQGKNEKISQLRELLAKNLKNQSGSSFQSSQERRQPPENSNGEAHANMVPEGAFKQGAGELVNGPSLSNATLTHDSNKGNTMQNGNGIPYTSENSTSMILTSSGPQMYNGSGHNVPQSPTTRTQQYDFVPISDGCHSPANFNSKSPLGFGQRSVSPSKTGKSAVVGGSLQTSPVSHSHSTAASPFVSPRNTPVPRSRLCPRPIPKHSGKRRRNPLVLGNIDACQKQFAMPNDHKFVHKSMLCGPGVKYCQPMSAPPSPNIISSHQYKNHMFQNAVALQNGHSNVMSLNFLPNGQFREHMNGDLSQPLSADPLSSEVSQFFQDPLVSYRSDHDPTFRSQSVPLKQGINNMGLLYNKTPVGSVPPTPVPNEFCDFGSLAETCDISRAGLNPETLDKIYDAIDSSNDVLNADASQNLLSASEPILADELNTLIPSDELLDRNSQFNQTFADEGAAAEHVEDFLKRSNGIELNLAELVTDKSKYYLSRSVPGTPLPYKRTAPNLQIDPRRSRELFASDNFSVSNGISSKSVPSTPQMVEEQSVFSYSNRDFLINGNSVECGGALHGGLVGGGGGAGGAGLGSPLHEDMLEPLTPAADLLADLDKIEGAPYVDL